MNKLIVVSVSAVGTATRNLAALIGLAIAVSACDARTVTPIAPSPGTAPSAATFTLSGAVSEMLATGPAPIAGARVTEISSGRAAVTDASGVYSLPGLAATNHALSVSRAGYVTGTMTVTLGSDTQFDIQLTRAVAYVLSGVVYEMTSAGRLPIEGVELYCDSCGSPDGHTFVQTDADGSYRLAWTMNGRHPLFVTKPGYAIFDPAGSLLDPYGRIAATVSGDTRFDIQLARR